MPPIRRDNRTPMKNDLESAIYPAWFILMSLPISGVEILDLSIKTIQTKNNKLKNNGDKVILETSC